ncbi:major facilitator superfamily domain-containing protein [Aspergillus pseudodeflectus]|uniref:Major facilitator superfamily domain-containing protein n=1 Tax=Aspergillus pseudodeflectus TaxID=176178 RepID=A0ABR4KTM0_9EURO
MDQLPANNDDLDRTDTTSKDQASVTQVEDAGQPGSPLRIDHLHGKVLVLAFAGWLVTEFMGGMGGNMLAPALPVISSQFDALDKLGWVSGAYYMTQCGSMLLFGQFSELFNAKYALLGAISIFMLGSTLSGAGQNTTALIAGRAVAGIGSAGCYITCQTLVAYLVDLEYRPMIFGLFGLQNAISGTVGPIIAGAFANSSDSNLWRMCFLIVLPLGAISIALNIFVMPAVPALPLEQDLQEKLQARLRLVSNREWNNVTPNQAGWLLVDWLGFIVVTSSLVCFVLAMQWGGSTYAWNSTTVIGLFVAFAGLFVVFTCTQGFFALFPLMPFRVLRNRTVVGACMMALFCFMCNLFITTYLPVVYEAGRGSSSLQAGINMIPYLLSIILAQLAEGMLLKWTKYYWYWGILSPSLIALGSGLLWTIDSSSSSAKLIGFQIICGLGIGLTQGIPIIAVQADNKEENVSAALSILAFTQLFGGMCGPVIGSAILNDRLAKFLPAAGVDPEVITKVVSSVFNIWDLPEATRNVVIEVYIRSLRYIFIVPAPLTALVITGGLIMRNVPLGNGARH